MFSILDTKWIISHLYRIILVPIEDPEVKGLNINLMNGVAW